MQHWITMIIIDTVPSGLKEFSDKGRAGLSPIYNTDRIYSPQSITSRNIWHPLGRVCHSILLNQSNFYACVLFDIGDHSYHAILLYVYVYIYIYAHLYVYIFYIYIYIYIYIILTHIAAIMQYVYIYIYIYMYITVYILISPTFHIFLRNYQFPKKLYFF